MERNPIQEEREKCVKKCIPDLFSGKYRSVLYVGANQKRQHFLDNFENSKYDEIVIIEAFHENFEFLKRKFENDSSKPYRVIEGDIRDMENFDLPSFDVVFFWHGIEHLPEKDIESTLKKLEKKSKHLVVLGMPFGKYDQGPEYGNPYEEHVSVIYPATLEKFGYKTETLGNADEEGSNMTAWKYLNSK